MSSDRHDRLNLCKSLRKLLPLISFETPTENPRPAGLSKEQIKAQKIAEREKLKAEKKANRLKQKNLLVTNDQDRCFLSNDFKRYCNRFEHDPAAIHYIYAKDEEGK